MSKQNKNETKYPRQYAKLGHFIMGQVYNHLYHNYGAKYRDLKRHISLMLKEHHYCIDSNFAMHEYNHGNSKLPDSCTYRWENIFDFYVRQHIKAGFLYRPETNKDIIEITNPTFIALADGDKYPQQMFNEARKILGQQYETKRMGR